MELKLGIIGHGFVGTAVDNGFDKKVDKFIVDINKNNNTIQDLVKFDPSLVFVCVPTPQQETHEDVDISIVRDVLINLNDPSIS